MCSTASSGGRFPCSFHTTMGTSQTSQSATQHTSSSWCQGVMRAASHSSQCSAFIPPTSGPPGPGTGPGPPPPSITARRG